MCDITFSNFNVVALKGLLFNDTRDDPFVRHKVLCVMKSETVKPTKSRRFTPVKQFCIYADNKVGRLNELLGMFAGSKIHVIALSTWDSTDSSLIRLVVDYPEAALALLEENGFAFSLAEVVAVEFETEATLKKITCALMEAEINIHYVYPFLMRPNNRSGLLIRVEDNDLASDVLTRHQITVLSQEDIAR